MDYGAISNLIWSTPATVAWGAVVTQVSVVVTFVHVY